jgi:hypothetical protein
MKPILWAMLATGLLLAVVASACGAPEPKPQPQAPPAAQPNPRSAVQPAAPLRSTTSPASVVIPGDGDSKVSVSPRANDSVLKITYDSRDKFVVMANRDTEASVNGPSTIRQGLIVDTNGPYQGSHYVAGTGRIDFTILASGPWELRLDPISKGSTPQFQGTGDAVSSTFDSPLRDFLNGWNFTHDGLGRFEIRARCARSNGVREDTVVYTIGSGPGKQLNYQWNIPAPATCLWEVHADGPFSISPAGS